MQVKSLRYPQLLLISIANSNLPAIDTKIKLEGYFIRKTIKNDFIDLATESSDSVASLNSKQDQIYNQIKSNPKSFNNH
jgi:hypothetical protein